jgi:hypothetical protein
VYLRVNTPPRDVSILKGSLDFVGLRRIAGWVQNTAKPETPVSLVITDSDQVIARVLANRFRDDLKKSGIGNGRHSFEFTLTPPLSPFQPHVVRVYSETDGIDVPGSPVMLEPSRGLGDVEKEYMTGLLGQLGNEDEVAKAGAFSPPRPTFSSSALPISKANAQTARRFGICNTPLG